MWVSLVVASVWATTVCSETAAVAWMETNNSSTISHPFLRKRAAISNREYKPHRKGRKLALTLDFYNSSAITFLREYGMHYHLFDAFFNVRSDGSTVGALLQNLSLIASGTDNLSIKTENIEVKYELQNYQSFKTWEISTANVNPNLAALQLTYNPPTNDSELSFYNNKYRYGPGIEDRFMSIGFDKDPWTESTPNDPANVHFIGIDTALPLGFTYICKFKSPMVAQSTASVKRDIHDVLGKLTKNNIIKCPIPQSIISLLNTRHKAIVLDFVSSQAEGIPVMKLLSDVSVPRLHALSRRKFKLVMQTMVEVLDDAMVVEWITYNILLGFEHFYIYYNAKRADASITNSMLRPYLDANIITLVYFPFYHPIHFNRIQRAALNAYQEQYGRYTDMVAYWDVDEFFLPSSNYRPNIQNTPYDAPVVPKMIAHFAGRGEPGIMFDTLDMGCAEGDNNFYVGGDNIRPTNGATTAATSAAASPPVQYVIATQRPAVTTHCQRFGKYFNEMTEGHGKMLIRPSKVEYISSPHRLNYYWVVNTKPSDGGWMCHFNRFRNTLAAMAEHIFWDDMYGTDPSLSNFTLATIKGLAGVTQTQAT